MNRRASLLALRWVASLTLALLLIYSPAQLHPEAPPWLGWAVCMALALSNGALHRATKETFRQRRSYFLLFVLDLLLVSFAVYLTSSTDASELAFFVALLLCALSGAVTGDTRASFIIGLAAGGIYFAQLSGWGSSWSALLEPQVLLRLPLLLVLSLTSALLSRGGERVARHRAEVVAAFARQLRITMSPKEIAAELEDVLIRMSAFRQVALYLPDVDQVTLRQVGDSRLPNTLDARRLPESVASRIMNGQAAHAKHLASARPFTDGLKIRPEATFIVGVNFTDRAPGLLIAEHRQRIFDHEPLSLLLAHLADHTAGAITSARMVENAHESAIGLHSLLKMSEAVSSTLRIRDILLLLEEFCMRLVGVRFCNLWVGRSTMAGMSGGGPDSKKDGGDDSSPQPMSGRASPLERAAAIKVWETGTELLLNSREAVEAMVPGATASNLMALPLRTANEIIGVLQAIDKPEPFNQRDHSLLEGLASQATIALVNARLVEGLEERAVRISHLVETLAAEKQKLEHVLSNMEEGVALLDSGGKVVLANHAGRRLLAPRGVNPLPAPASAFRDPLGVLPRLSTVLATRRPVHETVPDGERFFELSTALLEGDEGAIAVIRDITELVRLDAMRSDFVSHVSHELRTPLAAIIGSIKLILQSAQLSESHDRLLRIVERESGRLMQLINNLLDLAKLEAGRVAIEKEPVNLGAVIAEAVESIQSLAAAKSIRLAVEGDPPSDTVPCDPALIRQVLHNLIGNAIKFTSEGGLVRVAARMGPRWAVVRVIDTGVGVPRDKWESVFNKFEQLSAHKGHGKGTGLGLAICRQIVEGHGGQIGMISDEGQGSTFYFTLPRGEPIVDRGAPGRGGIDPPTGSEPGADQLETTSQSLGSQEVKRWASAAS